ncbi:hypothetical protein HMPREF0496_0451 [Lentilactobacillus hilgardii ATCC 27305]|nr:hypothetical protein HMPREF0496_0451 [Lentilactobacillus hilgardii ATCC 27305]
MRDVSTCYHPGSQINHSICLNTCLIARYTIMGANHQLLTTYLSDSTFSTLTYWKSLYSQSSDKHHTTVFITYNYQKV